MISKMFDTEDTSDAPISIRLEYKIVFDKPLHASLISISVYMDAMLAEQ